MQLNKIYYESCIDTMAQMPDNFIDLVMTSPPYADIKDYGINFDITPEHYPDWLLDKIIAMERILKQTGSIIIVIDDVFKNKFLNPYVFKTVIKILDNTNLKLAQRHYWYKFNSMPDNTKRLKNSIENIFHFVKDSEYYANKDIVRIESKYAKTDKRAWKYNPLGADPTNVIQLKKTQNQKDIHPALYPVEIPYKFIKYLCPEDGIVYDSFIGSGTTAIACEMLKRKWIGSEINKNYEKIFYDNNRLNQEKFFQ